MHAWPRGAVGAYQMSQNVCLNAARPFCFIPFACGELWAHDRSTAGLDGESPRLHQTIFERLGNANCVVERVAKREIVVHPRGEQNNARISLHTKGRPRRR